MLEQITVKVIGQDAQVDLKAAAQPDARFGRPFRQNGLGSLPPGKVRDDLGRLLRSADDVDVADGHFIPAQTARKCEAFERRSLAQVFDGSPGDR